MKMIGIYTAAGKQLAARAQAEGLRLQITRAVSGSTLSSQNANVMARERQTLSIGSKTAQDGKCTVSAVLNAAEASAMYSLREVGLYARLAEEEEVLYKVFQLNESLTIGEKFTTGLTTMILGMCVVFSVLLIIMLILQAIGAAYGGSFFITKDGLLGFAGFSVGAETFYLCDEFGNVITFGGDRILV